MPSGTSPRRSRDDQINSPDPRRRQVRAYNTEIRPRATLDLPAPLTTLLNYFLTDGRRDRNNQLRYEAQKHSRIGPELGLIILKEYYSGRGIPKIALKVFRSDSTLRSYIKRMTISLLERGDGDAFVEDDGSKDNIVDNIKTLLKSGDRYSKQSILRVIAEISFLENLRTRVTQITQNLFFFITPVESNSENCNCHYCRDKISYIFNSDLYNLNYGGVFQNLASKGYKVDNIVFHATQNYEIKMTINDSDRRSADIDPLETDFCENLLVNLMISQNKIFFYETKTNPEELLTFSNIIDKTIEKMYENSLQKLILIMDESLKPSTEEISLIEERSHIFCIFVPQCVYDVIKPAKRLFKKALEDVNRRRHKSVDCIINSIDKFYQIQENTNVLFFNEKDLLSFFFAEL